MSKSDFSEIPTKNILSSTSDLGIIVWKSVHTNYMEFTLLHPILKGTSPGGFLNLSTKKT